MCAVVQGRKVTLAGKDHYEKRCTLIADTRMEAMWIELKAVGGERKVTGTTEDQGGQ